MKSLSLPDLTNRIGPEAGEKVQSAIINVTRAQRLLLASVLGSVVWLAGCTATPGGNLWGEKPTPTLVPSRPEPIPNNAQKEHIGDGGQTASTAVPRTQPSVTPNNTGGQRAEVQEKMLSLEEQEIHDKIAGLNAQVKNAPKDSEEKQGLQNKYDRMLNEYRGMVARNELGNKTLQNALEGISGPSTEELRGQLRTGIIVAAPYGNSIGTMNNGRAEIFVKKTPGIPELLEQIDVWLGNSYVGEEKPITFISQKQLDKFIEALDKKYTRGPVDTVGRVIVKGQPPNETFIITLVHK